MDELKKLKSNLYHIENYLLNINVTLDNYNVSLDINRDFIEEMTHKALELAEQSYDWISDKI